MSPPSGEASAGSETDRAFIPTTGIDLVEIDRVAGVLNKFGGRFLDRVYTQREQRYCGGRAERLAGRFAAKEAVSKALGIGIRRLSWRDIEVLPDEEGKPHVFLYGKASIGARVRGIKDIDVSITHSRVLASAVAVGRKLAG